MEHEDKSLFERLRETGVGLEDPNIAGDPDGDDDDQEVDLIEEAEPGDDRPIEV